MALGVCKRKKKDTSQKLGPLEHFFDINLHGEIILSAKNCLTAKINLDIPKYFSGRGNGQLSNYTQRKIV